MKIFGVRNDEVRKKRNAASKPNHGILVAFCLYAHFTYFTTIKK